jgi:hypothetical protein
MTKQSNNKQVLGSGVQYSGARPLKFHVDNTGSWWLCDKGINATGGFASQGCWNYAEMPFDRND